jgi:hypothetical protein
MYLFIFKTHDTQWVSTKYMGKTRKVSISKKHSLGQGISCPPTTNTTIPPGGRYVVLKGILNTLFLYQAIYHLNGDHAVHI